MAFILLGLIGLLDFRFVFASFLVVFLLEAIALALESGAMQAWFDNNYKLMIEDQDQDLQIYRGVFGKTLLLIRAIGSGAIYLGGFLTDTIDREGVFLIQGVFMLLLALLFLITIEDFQTRGKTVTSLKDFLADLFLGFKLLFQSRSSLFFQLSYIISIITNLLWTSLIIYPLYFGYTGSDPKAATFRSLLFLVGGLMTLIGVTVSKKINMRRWLPITVLVYGLGFYGGFAFILLVFPIQNEYNFTPLAIIFLLSTIGIFVNTVWLLLLQKFMMSIIPDENRNAFYSLSPTLALLVGSGVAFFLGRFIELYDPQYEIAVVFFLVIPTVVAAIALFISLRDYLPIEEVDPDYYSFALDNTLFGPESTIDLSKFATNIRLEGYAKNLLHHLLVVAHEDEKVTEEEHKLLEGIISNFKDYIHLVDTALQDGIIDISEKKSLLTGREKMLDDAYQIASADTIISEDEYAILDKLVHIIRELEKLEN
jgi:hypothetical protein